MSFDNLADASECFSGDPFAAEVPVEEATERTLAHFDAVRECTLDDWLSVFIPIRSGGVPMLYTPSPYQSSVEAAVVFYSLPASPPFTALEQLERDEDLYRVLIGKKFTFMEGSPLSRSVLWEGLGSHADDAFRRAIAYSRLVLTHSRVRDSWFEYVFLDLPYVPINHVYQYSSRTDLTLLERELERRDRLTLHDYEASGGSHFLHTVLQAGPQSPLQHLVASFLSTRFAEPGAPRDPDPFNVPVSRVMEVRTEHPDILFPPPPPQQQAQQTQPQRSSGSKRESGAKDTESNKKARSKK